MLQAGGKSFAVVPFGTFLQEQLGKSGAVDDQDLQKRMVFLGILFDTSKKGSTLILSFCILQVDTRALLLVSQVIFTKRFAAQAAWITYIR